MEGLALGVAPHEGAVLALCRWSTGATRDTLLISSPIAPQQGDLSYHRGRVVTVTARYWNRAIDAIVDGGAGAGVAVLHTHPGGGVPSWSIDDDRADIALAGYLFGEGHLPEGAPLLSMVASHSDVRGRALTIDTTTGRVVMRPVERIRTLSPERIKIESTVDRRWPGGEPPIPAHADRSIRVFGRDGQRLLADLHVALVGAGGVGSLCGDHAARWGVGRISIWDADIVKDVNVNRSGVYTYIDAVRRRFKAAALARALPRAALAPRFESRCKNTDVREKESLAELLDADVILVLVDDARPRNFINRLAFAHYIPAIDAGNVIRSTAEDDASAETATVEGGGVRISHLTPGGPCLWCAGHLTPQRLSLAYRSDVDKAADRARGYVEHLGPEHAPSVMPVNAMTAALVEHRLQDLLFGLSARAIPEIYFDLVGGSLDELPRAARTDCRHCSRWSGRGDAAELPFVE